MEESVPLKRPRQSIMIPSNSAAARSIIWK
jgi:hypothetical protein